MGYMIFHKAIREKREVSFRMLHLGDGENSEPTSGATHGAPRRHTSDGVALTTRVCSSAHMRKRPSCFRGCQKIKRLSGSAQR